MSYPAIISPSACMGDTTRGKLVFKNGSNWYVIGKDNNLGNVPGVFTGWPFRAFKSTDEGMTWVEQDAAGAPVYEFNGSTGLNVGGVGNNYTVAIDGTTVMVVWVNTTDLGAGHTPQWEVTDLRRSTFDLATDLWGLETTFANPGLDFMNWAGGSDSNRLALQLVVRASSDYILLYSGTQAVLAGNPAARISYSTFNGSTFGAETQLPGQGSLYTDNVFYEQSGAIHDAENARTHISLYAGFLGGGVGDRTLLHVSLADDGTFGTMQVVADADSTARPYYGGQVGNDFIAVPEVYGTGGGRRVCIALVADDHVLDNGYIALFDAAAAADPTWPGTPSTVLGDTDQPPMVLPQFFTGNGPWLTVTSIGGTLVVVWSSENADTGDGEVWYAASPTGTFSWSAPTLLFTAPEDSDANLYRMVGGVCAVTLTATIVGVLGVAATQSTDDSETLFAIISIAADLSLSCNNPPDGTVGLAYDHSLLASGGTPPYAFAITAGALPDGLTLDAATGEISGTPTLAGAFPFTAQVTDADANTATVNCSITIASGSASVNCSISINAPPVLLSSGPFFHMSGCCPNNKWDDRLDRIAAAVRKIYNLFGPRFNIPEDYKNLLPWDEDAGFVPPGAIPVRKTGGITTPAASAGDQTMISFRVNKGYDGLVTGFYFQYSGLGFVQGSGDILYRIRVNQRYVKDLANVPFLIGSPQTIAPMTEGQIVQSDQLIQAIVNVPNLSGLIQVGASTVSAGLFGFLWPR